MTTDELPVPAGAAGERLDVFLAGAAGSRTAAQQLIDAGCVLVDGVGRAKRHKLAGGERVTVAWPVAPEVTDAPPAQFRIAYEDDDVLVVDKPAGVVVHPAPGHPSGTLAQAGGAPYVQRVEVRSVR